MNSLSVCTGVGFPQSGIVAFKCFGRSPARQKLQTRHQTNQRPSLVLCLPPSVAESRKCVPYFLMMLSVMALRLGRLPSCLMVCRNSGSSGRAKPLFSCLSRARLFTFQRPNSLPRKQHGHALQWEVKQ